MKGEARYKTTFRGAGNYSDRNYRQAHGVFVGVEDGLNPIGAVDNVSSLSRALAPVLSTSTNLTGKHATRAAILGELENVVQAAHPRDLVIVYFSTSTVFKYDDLYLKPSDFESGHCLATGVSFSLVSAVVGSTPDVKSLIILDIPDAAGVGFDMSRYRVGSELGLMVSCGPEESSFSTKRNGKRHGNFTWGLIQELKQWRPQPKNKNDRWSGLLLCDWFDDACRRTVDRDGRQHPIMLGALSPNLKLRYKRQTDGKPTDIRGEMRPHRGS